jgi:hypothetical protein
MTEKSEQHDPVAIIGQIWRNEMGERQRAGEEELDPNLLTLRRWQSERLAQTHGDLLQSERFGPACRFFLTDIYGPRDFSQRDQDLLQVYNAMKPFLPRRIVETMKLTVDLNAMTGRLDNALCRVLFEEMGVKEISGENYAEAYRRCDNYDERMRQIDMIVDLGQHLDTLSRSRFVSVTLRLARGPAHLAGWAELQDFLERGFRSFKHMKGADPFLNAIERREKEILDRIYDEHPHPFDVN